MNDIVDTQRWARTKVAEPGDWLTGEQRVAVWREVRASETNELDLARKRALSPNAVDGRHDATAELSAAAVEVVHRTASDPGRLTRAWADEQIAQLGEEAYAELVWGDGDRVGDRPVRPRERARDVRLAVAGRRRSSLCAT